MSEKHRDAISVAHVRGFMWGSLHLASSRLLHRMGDEVTQFLAQPAPYRCASTAGSANTARIEMRKKQGRVTAPVGWVPARGIGVSRQSEQAVTNKITAVTGSAVRLEPVRAAFPAVLAGSGHQFIRRVA